MMESTTVKADYRALLVEVERAGAAMADMMLNLSLRSSTEVNPDLAASMDAMRRAWDLALGRLRQAATIEPAAAEAAASPVQAQPIEPDHYANDSFSRLAADMADAAIASESNGKLGVAAFVRQWAGRVMALSVQAQPVADNLRAEIEKLTHWKHCMSYSGSYFGEPAGLVRRVAYQLERILATPPEAPAAAPAEVQAACWDAVRSIPNLPDGVYSQLKHAILGVDPTDRVRAYVLADEAMRKGLAGVDLPPLPERAAGGDITGHLFSADQMNERYQLGYRDGASKPVAAVDAGEWQIYAMTLRATLERGYKSLASAAMCQTKDGESAWNAMGKALNVIAPAAPVAGSIGDDAEFAELLIAMAESFQAGGPLLVEATSKVIAYIDARQQPTQPLALGDAEKAIGWFNVLAKCAELLGMPDDQPIIQVDKLLAERLASPQPVAGGVPDGFVLVPLRLNRAMQRVLDEEDWQWEDLLAAAEAITEEQYNQLAAAPLPAVAPDLSARDAVLSTLDAAVERVKRLSVWDGLPHALHVELDAIFAAIRALDLGARDAATRDAALVAAALLCDEENDRYPGAGPRRCARAIRALRSQPAAVAQESDHPFPDLANALHYPDCWDTAAYPTVQCALREVAAFACSECKPIAQESLSAAIPEAERKDAARYRWLREHGTAQGVIDWNAIGAVCQDLGGLDAAIDAQLVAASLGGTK